MFWVLFLRSLRVIIFMMDPISQILQLELHVFLQIIQKCSLQLLGLLGVVAY